MGVSSHGSRFEPRIELLVRPWDTGLEAKLGESIEPDLFGKGALQQQMGDALTALVTNCTSVVISKTMSHVSLSSPTAISSSKPCENLAFERSPAIPNSLEIQ
jgi:hypothetical protein